MIAGKLCLSHQTLFRKLTTEGVALEVAPTPTRGPHNQPEQRQGL